MYIMLSIEATVYADSNDKYSSIFKISKTKKLGLLSELKYSVKYLQVFGVWYQGLVVYLLYRELKCPVPSLTQSAEGSACFLR